ncbi:putative ribosomal protein L39e [Helianthus anomalus]
MIKKKLVKKMTHKRPIGRWIRRRTGNIMRYKAKHIHWRRTKLGF